jgi:hypothetical protein
VAGGTCLVRILPDPQPRAPPRETGVFAYRGSRDAAAVAEERAAALSAAGLAASSSGSSGGEGGRLEVLTGLPSRGNFSSAPRRAPKAGGGDSPPSSSCGAAGGPGPGPGPQGGGQPGLVPQQQAPGGVYPLFPANMTAVPFSVWRRMDWRRAMRSALTMALAVNSKLFPKPSAGTAGGAAAGGGSTSNSNSSGGGGSDVDSEDDEDEEEEEREEGVEEQQQVPPPLSPLDLGDRDPLRASYNIASALPCDLSSAQRLLEAPTALDRFLLEISLLRENSALCCVRCSAVISDITCALGTTPGGASGAFVNPHGYVHDLVTVLSVKRRLGLYGEPTEEHSW